MGHAVQAGSGVSSGVRRLQAWFAAVARGELTLRDLRMSVTRRIFLKEQKYYNFYIKKYRFLDQRNSRNVTAFVLVGAHDYA